MQSIYEIVFKEKWSTTDDIQDLKKTFLSHFISGCVNTIKAGELSYQLTITTGVIIYI